MQMYETMLIWLSLLRLLLLIIGTTKASSWKETGSRPTSEEPPTSLAKLGNVYARGRDFRWMTSPWKPVVASVYESYDIGDLIGGHVNFFTPDDFLWEDKKKKKKRLESEKKDKIVWNSKMKDFEVTRNKRQKPWIQGNVDVPNEFLKMHAFVVRDGNILQCNEPADKFSQTRYFMCSGVILNKNHVLTSASCINRAEIYEYHINAELAVLTGALDMNSYVIKIDHYKIHPGYVPDPNSINYAANNVAMIILSCSIPEESRVFPNLPINLYDDMGHMCCQNRCKLLTVIENIKNELIVEMMQIKYSPLPIHQKKSDNTFLSDFTKKSIDGINVLRKGFSKYNLLRRKFRQLQESSDFPTEVIATTNEPTIIEDTSTTLNKDLTIENMNPLESTTKVIPKNKISNSDSDGIMKKNVYCPPLGSPVVADNTLVALVAYTCDDLQNWIEWKYVDISQNIDWIRLEIQN